MEGENRHMGKDRAILVTGAGGFIGRSVGAALRRTGLNYVGLDRRPGDDPVTGWQVCDITDGAALATVFRTHTIGAVIHLAAVLPTAARAHPELATRVNVVGSANLIDAAVSSGVERFIFGSSMSVYGAEGNGSPLSEDCPAQPTDLYGAAKRYVEIYGETIAQTKRLSFTALRIATVVGPGARHTASPWRSEIFERLGTGASRPIVIPYPEDAVLSLVHVEDVARMLILLARRENIPSQTYNTPAENCRARELKRLVEALEGSPRVELDNASQRRAPPVADGARFVRDFAYAAPSLAERLGKAAAKAGV